MNILLYNVIFNAILVGVIIMTQFITYPLFQIIESDFTKYHQKYTKLMSYVVAPLMIIELILVLIITINYYDNLLVILNASLIIIIWSSTFFLQVPKHNLISQKKIKSEIVFLIRSNYIRTLCWILKLIISLQILDFYQSV